MERTKRKYKKHKFDKKVSVRFYLNKKLKAKSNDDKLLYPIYVQVTANSQTRHFKSLTNLYTSDAEFEIFIENNKSLFLEEERIIKKTVQTIQTNTAQDLIDYNALDLSNRIVYNGILWGTERNLHEQKELDDLIESSLKEILLGCLVFDKTVVDHKERSYFAKLIDWDRLEAKYIYENISKIVKEPTPSYELALANYSFLATHYQKGIFRSVFPLGIYRCDWIDGEFVTIWREKYNGPDKDFIENMIPAILQLLKPTTLYFMERPL
ncbi:hypothetical protein [Spirosoma endbachense]|uniref:Uncharacterized protein n=1 Tax=Spirosoma endbachense TaxID=2666025 RepID=A0A6P1W066_9BACT|nr:hypothetical protein [Spirosoma endbachense]QHV98284.1 hypothetical protein GJR95_26245 [Spirosoma endbachense]